MRFSTFYLFFNAKYTNKFKIAALQFKSSPFLMHYEAPFLDNIINIVAIWFLIMLWVTWLDKTMNKYFTYINNKFYFELGAIFFSYLLVLLFIMLANKANILFGNITKIFYIDLFIVFFFILLIISTVFILDNSWNHFLNYPRLWTDYPLFILLATGFLTIMLISFDLIILFSALLGFSFCLYVLLFCFSEKLEAREAGIKYFYLSALSSGILLFGIFLTYYLFQTTNFIFIKWKIMDIYNLAFFGESYLLWYSVILITIGFLFKLSAFPCHLWTPEIYDGSATPVAVFLMLPVKIAILGSFFRFATTSYETCYFRSSFTSLMFFAVVGSMTWGCIAALQERKLKRFIAYTSINQMGFLLTAIVLSYKVSYLILSLYLFLYCFMLLSLILILLTTVKKNNKKINEVTVLVWVSDLNYFGKKYFYYSLFLIIIIFSMAGIPPLGGFFGKTLIFLIALQHNSFLLLFISLITSLISTFYYLNLIKIMWFENYLEKLNNEKNKNLISDYEMRGKNIKQYSIFSMWARPNREAWPSYYVFSMCVGYIIFTPFWLGSFIFNFQLFICLLILVSIVINLESFIIKLYGAPYLYERKA